MSTHMPGVQSFLSFLHDFVLAKLATSSIRVKGVSTRLCLKTKNKYCKSLMYSGSNKIAIRALCPYALL